ncbi:complement control/ sushi-like repeats protein [Sarcoptes scabiei]|uniref:Complement control/ sushi-like repeats protein n=1 Tax=Sarcoptes scabiei TaxID=52283 RepID=A0A132A165_SARSC|nr:complement control/ sushi-like repeats protein [Sarcoptes scabiei]
MFIIAIDRIDINERTESYQNQFVFCGAPPLVPNAQSDLLRQQKHFVFQVGSEAEYLCEYGYRAVNGTSKTRCIIDGINIDTAHHVLFEALNSDQNSRITSDRSKYSKVMLHHDDEEPEPNSSIQRSPNDLFNRKKSSRKNDDDLYEIEGQPNAKKIQAHWYPPITLDCQLVYCPDPGQVKHARRNDPKINPFAYNTNVHYACEEGYETIGVPFLTCRQDGTWNRQPPECRLKQCPLITEPKNGWIKYSDNNRPTHSRAEYYCNQGYRLNALSNTRHCGSNNSWTLLEQTPLIFISPSIDSKARNDSYECLPVTCPTPSKPHNGLRIVDVNRKQRQNRQNFIPGDIIIYNCISNKIRATARCNSDGEWSRGMPHCPIDETINSLKCKPFDSFTHGSVKYVENAAVFSCKDGFELEGKSTINCNPNGVWNGPLPRCVLKMAAPPELVPTTSNTISSISDTVITNESIDDQEPKISKTLMILLILISIVLFVLIVVATVSFYHWRQRRLNSKTWQRYFGHYYHRQSKTNIMLSTQFGANMHHNHNHHQNHTVNGVQNATIGSTASSIGSTSNTTTTARLLPRTGKLSRQKSAGYQLQSSFSSGDENNSDMKSFTTDQTITSERARTISTYVDDTCAEYEDEEEDEFVEEDEDDDQDEDGASIFRHPSIPIAIAAKKNNSLPLDILSSSINDQNYMDSFGDHSNLGEDASIMNSTRQGYNPAKRALSSGNAHQLNGNYHQQSSSSQSKPTSTPLAANNEMTLLTLNSTSSQNGNNFVIPVTDL